MPKCVVGLNDLMMVRNPSRYFLKLEREHIDCNVCSSILNSDGVEVFTCPEIERAHVDFYPNLFSPEPIDPACKQHLLSVFFSLCVWLRMPTSLCGISYGVHALRLFRATLVF